MSPDLNVLVLLYLNGELLRIAIHIEDGLTKFHDWKYFHEEDIKEQWYQAIPAHLRDAVILEIIQIDDIIKTTVHRKLLECSDVTDTTPLKQRADAITSPADSMLTGIWYIGDDPQAMQGFKFDSMWVLYLADIALSNINITSVDYLNARDYFKSKVFSGYIFSEESNESSLTESMILSSGCPSVTVCVDFYHYLNKNGCWLIDTTKTEASTNPAEINEVSLEITYERIDGNQVMIDDTAYPIQLIGDIQYIVMDGTNYVLK